MKHMFAVLRFSMRRSAISTRSHSREIMLMFAVFVFVQFQLSLSSLDTETCVVVLDYKEKLKYSSIQSTVFLLDHVASLSISLCLFLSVARWRLTKNERQQDFFENKQVSCLGCVVFTAIPSEEQLPNGPVLKRHVHNFLSQDTTQDGEWTNGALDMLLDTLSQTFKRIVVWSDNGWCTVLFAAAIHFSVCAVVQEFTSIPVW